MKMLWCLLLISVAALAADDALLLFQDGQARLQAGKFGTARLAFETLIAVYPESPLVSQAQEAIRTVDEMEQAQDTSPIIRSVNYVGFKKVTMAQIQQRLREREVKCAVEQRYDARDIEEARVALTEFLAEKGVRNFHVTADMENIPPRSAEITFRCIKD